MGFDYIKAIKYTWVKEAMIANWLLELLQLGKLYRVNLATVATVKLLAFITCPTIRLTVWIQSLRKLRAPKIFWLLVAVCIIRI